MDPLRRPLIAGNWKMHAGGADSCDLALAVAEATRSCGATDVLVAPPFTALAAVSHRLSEAGAALMVGAQNLHPEPKGAFTGEVAAGMLREAGADWVIVGHSERRQLFGETDELVARKTKAVLAAGLRPIVCVGETLAQREAGETLSVVERQLGAVLPILAERPGVGAIAYEPVWAIGTGRVAKPEDAQHVHGAIRGMLAEKSRELAQSTRVLYGGSVKPDNAEGLLRQPDIDGALVGGASLDAAGFAAIAQAAEKLASAGKPG
ncbi:MAG: triose-phosphate isomerase [Deltaproteobacteria bacterium]|nr:triose-phosphate isomerase [Deltaproteobacteria bacterium]